MWILNLLPESFIQYVVNGLIVGGAILVFLSFFVINKILMRWPTLAAYHLIIQFTSLVMLVVGVYFKGEYEIEMSWRHKVDEAQAKVAKAEQQARDANDALQKKSAEKVKVIQGKQIIVKQYIDREVTKYDNTCPVPGPVVKALDSAAKNEVPK